MKDKSVDTTRLRRAVSVAAVLLAVVVAAVIAARCSSPSQVVKAPAEGFSAEDALAGVNAAAAAKARLDSWAGQETTLVEARWLDEDTAVVTGAVGGGEHVAVTVVRSTAGWQVPWPPTAVAAPPAPQIEAFDGVPPAAASDERWQTAVGFLEAWLAGDDPWRWTYGGFRPDPPAVSYSDWSITGAGQPLAVPGAPIAVLPIDVEAAVEGGESRRYRYWVAVRAGSDGQVGVAALAHRPPPAAARAE